MQKWQAAVLARSDKVHFTRAGYELIGDLFYEAFSKMIHSTPNTSTNGTRQTAVSAAKPKDSVTPRSNSRTARSTVKRATIEKPATSNSNTPVTNDDRFPYISR